MGRAAGQLAACVLWCCNTPHSHCPICSINIYITLQKADEPNFLLKKKKWPKVLQFASLQSCAHTFPSCSPVTQFFQVSLTMLNPYKFCALSSLASLWGSLIFQVIWVIGSIGHSAFAFSAQFFAFVPCISREGSGHPAAQLQLFWLYLLRKYVNLFPGFCSVALPHRPDTSWSGGMGTGRGFLRPLIYLSWWQFLKTEVELL